MTPAPGIELATVSVLGVCEAGRRRVDWSKKKSD
jgi:hypothetical protein